MSSGISRTLSEYCSSEGERMGLDVAITRYALVDMDADGLREAGRNVDRGGCGSMSRSGSGGDKLRTVGNQHGGREMI